VAADWYVEQELRYPSLSTTTNPTGTRQRAAVHGAGSPNAAGLRRPPSKGEPDLPLDGDVPPAAAWECRLGTKVRGRQPTHHRDRREGVVRLCNGGRRAALGMVLAGLVALTALAACAPGGRAGASASPSPTGMSDAQIQVLVNQLVQCVRENGAPGMPDVTVRNGHVIVPDESTVDEATRRNVESALQACKAIEDRIPPSALNDQGNQAERRGPTAADVPKLRQFAACIRQHGVPEWPDPKADGTFPIRGTPLEREGKSARLSAAWQACRQYWDGGITGS
jgi:hypothetical protein